MDAPTISPAARPDRRTAAAVVAAVGIVSLSALDWYLGLTFNAAILYSALLLVCWWHHSLRFVWALTGAAVVLTIAIGFLEPTDVRAFLHRSAAVVSIVASAALLHALFVSRRKVEGHEESLRLRNEA